MAERPKPDVVSVSDVPLLEFDPDRVAMIEPSSHLGSAHPASADDMPPVAVACFFGDVVERVAKQHDARLVTRLAAEHGRHAVYELERGGSRFAFYQPGLGAPLAAGFLEEMIDYGARTIIACGGAGALSPSLTLGHVIIVSAALRDEGTSYHYLPPSRTVAADADVVAYLAGYLGERSVPYETGMTWTTDAFYRETRGKVARRREEGCITVEMESSALIAVSGFRGVRFGQLLYAGDTLAGEEWDHRDWVKAHDVREQLFWLAADAALGLGAQETAEAGSPG